MLDVHYFAAARAAAGMKQERIDNPPATLGELLEELAVHHTGSTDAGMGLREIFARCSFLIDGANPAAQAGGQKAADPESASLAGAERVDVLPPFAGG